MKIRNLLSWLFILAGCAASSGALVLLLKPGNMAPGGAGAIAAIISDMLPISLGAALLMVNIPLLALALMAGRHFLIKTLAGTLFYSLFAALWEYFPVPELENILRCIFGGALLGTGLGIIFSAGGSSGGSDIAAWFISRKLPHIKISKAMLICDLIIIAFQAFIYKSFQSALYAILALAVSAAVLDKTIEGRTLKGKTIYIISDRYREISAAIFEKINRGITALEAVGMYSGSSKKVLLCTLMTRQLPLMKSIISDIDSDAFVIVTDTREVLGKGFNNIDR